MAVCNKAKIRPGMAYPTDFAGMTFANNSGFMTPGKAFFEMVGQGKIKIEEHMSTEVNLRKVSAGRVDCYVNDTVSISQGLKQIGGGDTTAEAAVASIEGAYLGYSEAFQAAWKDDFISKMDDAIKALKADGTVDKIAARYAN